MKSIIRGEGKYRTTVMIHTTEGNGLCVWITGGEQPHVGGSAIAIPRCKSSGDGLTCDISMFCVPGHKDVIIASQVASRLAVAVNETVSVTAGIHIEHAQKEEIGLLSKNVMDSVEEWISGYTLGGA